MARKFSRNRRFVPESERALFKDQQFRQIDRIDLMDAIRGGEDSYLEFKVRLSNPEKLAAGICALANSGGGTIVFGVTDQMRLDGVSNPEIVEQDLLGICREQIVPPVWVRIDKVSFDSGLRIVVLEVDPRWAPHRTVDGRYYIRVGSTKREATGAEIAEMYRGRTGARTFEDTPLATGHTEHDIDEGALWTYVNEIRGIAPGGRDGFAMGALMQEMRLAVPYGDAPAPTVAGMLLFGHSQAVAKLLPQACVVARRVSGREVEDATVEEVEVCSNLGAAFDRVVGFLERYADLWESRPPKRQAAPVDPRPGFPREAVLEAISNALVHRDYAQMTPTRVTLFDDRLEIANPAPDIGLTRRGLELGVHEATNPRLKSLFFEPAYGAAAPRRGLAQILKRSAELPRRDLLRIAVGPDGFRVEIPAS